MRMCMLHLDQSFDCSVRQTTGSIFCRLSQQNIYKVVAMLLRRLAIGSSLRRSIHALSILLEVQKLLKHVVNICLHLLHVPFGTCYGGHPLQQWNIIADFYRSCHWEKFEDQLLELESLLLRWCVDPKEPAGKIHSHMIIPQQLISLSRQNLTANPKLRNAKWETSELDDGRESGFDYDLVCHQFLHSTPVYFDDRSGTRRTS